MLMGIFILFIFDGVPVCEERVNMEEKEYWRYIFKSFLNSRSMYWGGYTQT